MIGVNRITKFVHKKFVIIVFQFLPVEFEHPVYIYMYKYIYLCIVNQFLRYIHIYILMYNVDIYILLYNKYIYYECANNVIMNLPVTKALMPIKAKFVS